MSDLIERQAALDKSWRVGYLNGETEMVVSASDIVGLPTVNAEPCSDAISRAAAIKEIYNNEWRLTLENIVQIIRDLPSIHAEYRTGHWIDRKVIDDIKAEIEEPLHENRTINTDDARAQAIALMWCLQTIDKHLEKWEADNA